MHHYFFAIHQFVKRQKFLSVAIAFAMLLVFGFIASKIKFEEDITKLIPENEKSDATAKVLKQLNFADKITVIFHVEKNGNVEEMQQMATVFSDSVATKCKPYVNSIQGKVDDENIHETIEFVNNNLPLFLDEKDYQTIQSRINHDSIAATVQGNYKSILSPSGIVTRGYIQQDPLGIAFIALKKLQQLNIGDDFILENGFVMTKDKTKLLLFITSNLPSTETEKNALFAAKLNSIKDSLNKQFNAKASVSYFGSALIAVANANQIKSDIILSTSIAMATLMLILILFYRKIFIPLIIFVPTLFGALFAVALLYFIKEKISAISLGIGSILIGITIDYSLHILTHYKHNSDVKTLYKDITMPLIMSSTTTAVAFLCLLFVKSEALNDLGIFAAAIVIASAVFSLLIVPHLYKPKEDNFAHKRNAIDKLAGFSFHKNKVLIGLCMLVTIVCFFTYDNVRFNNDLSQLNFVPPDIKAAEKDLEQHTNLTSKTLYITAYGKTMAEALDHNSLLFANLAEEKKKGKILNFSSVGGIVLTESEQLRKIARWNSFWNVEKKQVLKAGLISEGEKLGFKPTTYTAFYDHLDKSFVPISVDEFQKVKTLQLQEFISGRNGFYTVSNLVKVKADQRDAFVKSVAALPNVVAIDRQQMNETFLGGLKNDFNKLVNYSFIAVILILFFFFRRIELVIISCIPIALTGIVTAGIMAIFDIELNIFSTIVCTLIFGHGVDFSIFMTSALQKKYTNGKNEITIYRTSIILAVITTILGIGALIFAKHPALRSISAVSLIGVFAAVVITFIFYPILFKLLLTNRPKSGRAPYEIRRLLHSILSFTYYGLGGFILSITGALLIKILPFSKKSKLKAFHFVLSKFMHSVLMSYPSIKRKIINKSGETFDKPAVIIANHTSYLDILAVGMLSPKIIFLVSDWVYNSPVFGIGVRLAGFYPVSNGIDNGVEHLRKKVNQGFSLMVFPEGTRSKDNAVKRFHKGAFYLAEQFDLDIIPVVIHGYSEAAPKGDFILNGASTTVEILERIKPDDLTFGKDYAERTKKMSTFFKGHYKRMRDQYEGPNYFKKLLIGSFDYKEMDVIKAVKDDFTQNSELYFQLNKHIGPKASILHLADDYGQLDILLALQEPQRKINSFIADREKRNVAETNYILKKRAISYLPTIQASSNIYDTIIVSEKCGHRLIAETAALAPQIILVDNVELKAKICSYGFTVKSDDGPLIVLMKQNEGKV